ncbi:trafficking protein particle complex subunit 12-like isoform X2 [Penaeus monodon]|uniref:trafficking protein particle complex subunit 12-like isoform X2 n=1 Tax=Penaeus monodon TaxID=6687 RepID=UPI0018A7195D|nr:trafficking protein particle complex subunit 12-like isoform X2 [Penaeus monodon]XP_037786828.1 trafficking protein particle complex subunit 12-like isoform X2 [Penaeus monodon]
MSDQPDPKPTLSNYFDQSSSSIFDQLSGTPQDAQPTPPSHQVGGVAPALPATSEQISTPYITPIANQQLTYPPEANSFSSPGANITTSGNASPSQGDVSLGSPYQPPVSVTPDPQLGGPGTPQPNPTNLHSLHPSHESFSTPAHHNIPLTPQNQEAVASTTNLPANNLPVPTPTTPSQSAMMMSMTTSMLVTDTSPNASMDVEATTVKFQQASIEEEAEPSSPSQTTLIHAGNVAMGIVAISAPPNNLQASTGSKPTSPKPPMKLTAASESADSFLTPATEQDVFTASLLSSDADRRHDAWIPSESTKQALIAMSTSPPGTYFPEKDLLTMPGIAVKEDFGDPVKNLVRTYLGEEAATKRVVLTAASVTQDDRGLRQLIAAGCYHAAVNLTTQLLTVYGQGEGRAGHPSKHTAHSIQLWFTRIALLIKLRRFSLAEVECQYFGDLDAPDLYFEFYPELYGGRRGSMVPFGFRLLVAELPQYLGKHTQALDRLNALLRNCNRIIENLSSGLSEDGSTLEMTSNMRDDSLKLWRTRRLKVLYSITNCAVSLKDFRLAGSLLERLTQEDPNSAAGLYSALGRLCLQLGDVTAAQDTFNHYLEHTPPPPHHDPVQGLLHSAYISIAQNAFKDATEILQQAHKINPNNGLVINNLGVCLMYTGRVTEAIKLVEGAVFSQPDRFLHEAIILNLATMYELESSNAHQNKLKLLSLIAQHKGDSFNVAALKLQPQ